MRILVTGANGYLGSGIVKELLERGHEVTAAGFRTDRVDAGAHRVACDIFALEKSYEHLGRPEVLLHLAWKDGFSHHSAAHIENLPRHARFIAEMTGAGVRTVAGMGTMHEIGFFEGSVNENTPCRPDNLYGIAKNALRDITKLCAERHGAVFQWLRGYYIVGNSEYGASVFSKIAAAEKRGETEFPFTTGSNQYDFLDYDEFCKQVAAAVTQNEINGIINICSGKPEKLADRVERFIAENGFRIKLRYGAFPSRPYDSKAIWGDSSKIEEILKRKPQKEEGV